MRICTLRVNVSNPAPLEIQIQTHVCEHQQERRGRAVFPVNQSEEDPAKVAGLCSGPRTGNLLASKEDGSGVEAQHSTVAFRLPYSKIKAEDRSYQREKIYLKTGFYHSSRGTPGTQQGLGDRRPLSSTYTQH